MIVEFCKYGNLSNYLRGKRDDFIVYKVRHETFWRRCFLITLACQQCGCFWQPYRKVLRMSAETFNLISFNMIYVEPGR